MVIIYNKNYKYAMLYVPKAACSVMRKTYIELHYDEFSSEEKKILNEHGIHRLGSLYPPLEPNAIYALKKFIVCRSPYTRAVSSYYDKFLALNNKTANFNTPPHIKNKKDWKTCRLYNLFSLYQITQSKSVLIKAIDLVELHKTCPSLTDVFRALNIHDTRVCDVKVDDSFRQYLLFLQMCKSQKIHTHKNIVYDEHHNLQTTTLLRYDINKIFNLNNINIVKIEDFSNLYTVYADILPENISSKAQRIHKEIINSRIFNNATPLNHIKNNMFCDFESSSFHYSQRNATNTLHGSESLLSTESKTIIQSIYAQDFKLLNYPF